MTTELVKGREYKVERLEVGPNTKAHMTKNGWDGFSYMLTGKRGAVYMAYRAATTGELHIVSAI